MKLSTIFNIVFLITSIFSLNSVSDEKSNKIVYLEIDSESEDDEALFAGLVIEDKVESPSKKFKKAFQPAPTIEITLSPSLRGYITNFERENAGEADAPSK